MTYLFENRIKRLLLGAWRTKTNKNENMWVSISDQKATQTTKNNTANQLNKSDPPSKNAKLTWETRRRTTNETPSFRRLRTDLFVACAPRPRSRLRRSPHRCRLLYRRHPWDQRTKRTSCGVCAQTQLPEWNRHKKRSKTEGQNVNTCTKRRLENKTQETTKKKRQKQAQEVKQDRGAKW